VPGSETQIYFENLEALYAYLAAQISTIEGKGEAMDGTVEK
jgi:hypothetical protein